MMKGEATAALAAIDNMAVELRRLRGLVSALSGRSAAVAPDPGLVGPVGHIVRVVAADFDVPVHWLLGDQRRRDVVEMRWLVMWLACRVRGITAAAVGRVLGRRDHTTVLHGLEKIEGRLESEPALRARAERLKAIVLGEEPGS